MKISNGTIVRTVVLIIALINQVLTVSGKNPLPFSENEIYEGASLILTTIASITSWWKNNSFTKNAIKADEYKASLKRQATV